VDAQDAATTVAENYSTSLKNSEQLTGLQSWVKKQAQLKKVK